MKRSLKDFLPLIIIALVIVGITTAAVLTVEQSFEFGMRIFMASFFGVFGFFKVINLKNFAKAYQMYDLVAMKSKLYAHLYPFIELTLAYLYLTNIGGVYRDIATIVIMGVGALGVLKKLKQKEEIPCACLGMVFVLPMTWVTLFEDLLMMVEAGIMIWLTL